jgi:hypothetical protein
MMSIPRAAQAVPVVLLVALLAGCGTQASSDSKSGASGGSTAPGESLPAVASRSDSGGSADRSATSSGTAAEQPAAPMNRAIISTGRISLHSRSVARARAEVMRLVVSWGGSVADEQSNSDRHGRIHDSTLTLRVPTADFARAMTRLARLGKVEQQSRASRDVTTRVVDNDARVRAAERSIRQIGLLMGRATKLSDVIAIESDLARRQADLDSLRSQQAWLANQTSLSTITVYLDRPGTPYAPARARGFLAGLDAGWDAFRTATVGLLTGVGAALPFALVLGLLGVPLWVVVRRRLAGRLSAGSAPARSA